MRKQSLMDKVFNNIFGYYKPQLSTTPKESKTQAYDFYGWSDTTQAPENDTDYLHAYNAHAWLFAGINAIGRNAARVPIKLFRKTVLGDLREQKDGWAVDLMRQPNPYCTKARLIFAIAAFKSLVGDCFLEKSHYQKPSQLWLLLPTQIKINKDPQTKVRNYEYRNNNQTVYFLPEEIVQFQNFNPLSEYFGTSDLSSLRTPLTIDWYAQAYEKAFFKNGGHIAGVLSTPKELDDRLLERTMRFVQEQYSGSSKAHKIAFFDNDVKYNKISVNPDEATVSELRNFNVREILAVLGVPRIIVQDSAESSWANAREQKATFWQEKMIPLLNDIADQFNLDIFQQNDLEMKFDYSVIEALREDDAQKSSTAVSVVNSNLKTINEVRKEVWNLPPVPWGNVARFPMGLEVVSKSEQQTNATPQTFEELNAQTAAINSPQQTEVPLQSTALNGAQVSSLLQITTNVVTGQLPVESAKFILQAAFPAISTQTLQSILKPLENFTARITTEVAKSANQDILSIRTTSQKLIQKALVEYFKSIENAFNTNAQTKMEKDTNYDYLLKDIFAGRQRFTDKLAKIELTQGGKFHEAYFKKTNSRATRPVWLNLTRKQYITGAVNKFADEIDKTTLEHLQNKLNIGVRDSKPFDTIVKDIQKTFKDTERAEQSRAETIARTELNKIENFSAVKAYQDAGFSHKTWKADGPPDDRKEHTAMDGETVPIDEPFSNGLMYPCDPNGEVGEIVNCACQIEPSNGEE